MNALRAACPTVVTNNEREFRRVPGIGGARRPLPEREQERPRLSATKLRRPRAKWP